MDGTGRYYKCNKSVREKTDIICFLSYVNLEKLNRRPWGKERGKKIVTEREGGKP